MDDNQFEKKLRSDFLIEARELISRHEDTLSRIKKESVNKELINELFRVAHTLKGSSLTAGFNEFGRLAHAYENLLSCLRLGSIGISQEVYDILVEGYDTLYKFLDILEEDFDAHIDTSSIETKLKNLLSISDFINNGEESTGTTKNSQTSLDEPEFEHHDGELFEVDMVKILVIDDDNDVKEFCVEILQEAGFDVQYANSGESALQLLVKGYEPDVVLTDLRMGDISGHDLISKIRKINRQIPVVIFSGYAERQDIIAFLNAGAYGFLEKPINRVLLLTTIRSAVNMRKMRADISLLTSLNNNVYLSLVKILGIVGDQANSKLRKQILAIDKSIAKIGMLIRKILDY